MTILRIALVGVLFACGSVSVRADGTPADAARRRADAFPRIEVKFHVKEFMALGSQSQGLPFRGVVPTPAKDTTTESDNKIVFDGSKIRLENNHPLWNVQKGVTMDNPFVAVTDGTTSQMLYTKGLADNPQPTGKILSTGACDKSGGMS